VKRNEERIKDSLIARWEWSAQAVAKDNDNTISWGSVGGYYTNTKLTFQRGIPVIEK